MKKIPTILIIDPRWHGIGYVNAAFAKGYRIVSVAPFEDHPKKYGYDGKYDGLIINSLENDESVIKAIENSEYNKSIDAVLPGNCFFTPLANKVAAHFKLRGEPYEAALRSRLKDLGRKAYETAGVPSTRYASVHNLDEALAAAKDIGFPVVLKPSDGGGSELVSLVSSEAELRKEMKALLTLEKTSFGFNTRQVFMVEEFVTGQEFSVELFIHNKKIKFSSVTEKISSALPYFVEIGHVVPTSVCTDKIKGLINTAHSAVLALGFSNGPFHVELRLSPRGPVIMETNGRMAGDLIATDLIPNAFGINLFDVFIEYLLGGSVEIKPTKNMAACIAFLTANKAGRVTFVKGTDELKIQKNIVKHHISIKVGDNIRPPQDNNNDRYGYVISVAETPEEAKESAFKAIGNLELIL